MKKPQKPLIERISKRNLRLLRENRATNAEIAEIYGVSPGYLSKVVNLLQKREPGKVVAYRSAQAKLFAARRQLREDLARKVVRKTRPITVEEAAAQANCSIRTMFRHVAKFRAAE